MSRQRPLFVPVVLGTPRQGRMSEHAAMLMHERVGLRQSDDEGDRRNPPHIERRIIDLDLDERCFVRISVWLCAAG